MIYYHYELTKKLSSQGISVPLDDDRASRIFDFLQKRLGKNHFLIPTCKKFSWADLKLAHSLEYINLLQEQPQRALLKCYDSYCMKGITETVAWELLNIILKQAYGTYEAMQLCLKYNVVYYLGGGMHHAMYDEGRGFCLINDIALGIKKLQNETKVNNVWIIDLDAHKGDGCAEIFQDDLSVRTFSIHMQNGWPLDGSTDKRSLIASDMDSEVGEKDCYLTRLKNSLKTFIKVYPSPDLICVVGGVDPWKYDQLASSALLQLTTSEISLRDKWVFEQLRQLDIPLCYVMAGGYGPDAWNLYANFIYWLENNLES